MVKLFKKGLFLLAAGVVIWMAFPQYTGALSVPAGSSPAPLPGNGPNRPVAGLEGPQTAPPGWFSNRDCAQPLAIMPLGNSITRGKQGTGPSQESPFNYGFRYYLDVSLSDNGYQFDFIGRQVSGEQSGFIFDYDNNGFAGDRADELRPRLSMTSTIPFSSTEIAPLLAPDQHPDVILLHIGTNDIAQGQTITSTVADVSGILDDIDDFDPEIVVIVAQIIDQNVPEPEVANFNALLASMVQNRMNNDGDKLALVDMYNALVYPADMADSLHPNDSGYNKMGDVWYAELASIWPACVVITSTAVTTATVGEPYTYDVDAVADPQPITYTLNNPPSGMSINPVTGVISWQPTLAQAGLQPIEVVVSNSVLTTTQLFTIEVKAKTLYLPLITK